MDRVSLFLVVFGVMLHCAAAQTVHIVGDGLGWTIPPNTSVSYSNWAAGKTFAMGDILVFNFMTNEHDLVRVPKASYDACSDDDEIGNVITIGPANVTLGATGDHYYICTFGRHCDAGQKLAITVGSSTPGAGGNPPMNTPPNTPTTPAPRSSQPDPRAPTPSSSIPNERGPTAATSSPPFSSAPTSLAASFLFVLLSIGMAWSTL